ncbi:MAG: type II toxin-antitoxin system VapC family toxin [Chloroflexi bacterium]|nr:type II toxin-antitoxin system VapC family toxin [Chloroflexota bacterium]
MDRRADAQLGVDRPPGAGRALSRIVIDASAALFASSGPEGFSALSAYEMVAPPLLWSEVTAALRQRAFRNEVSSDLAEKTLSTLLESRIERTMPSELYREAYSLAAGLGWAKSYDAEYVALARLLGCPLLTADARLRRGASRVIQTMVPDDV